jgi:hypothetical protein
VKCHVQKKDDCSYHRLCRECLLRIQCFEGGMLKKEKFLGLDSRSPDWPVEGTFEQPV